MFEVNCALGLDITHVMKMIFMISHGFEWSHDLFKALRRPKLAPPASSLTFFNTANVVRGLQNFPDYVTYVWVLLVHGLFRPLKSPQPPLTNRCVFLVFHVVKNMKA
jgi:hypothetical protein